MVAIDSGLDSGRQPILNIKLPLAFFIGAAAALIGLGAMVVNDFSESGLRLASELDWRFTCLVFFVAAIAGPVGRLLPFAFSKTLGALRRQLIWSVCASYGVYLATLLLPNWFGHTGIEGGVTGGMMLFALFSGLVMLVMAYAASREAEIQFGAATQRALISVAMSFFWLTYALTGLAHLSGPHRPDAFYGVSLGLIIFALLLSFSDQFIAKLRGIAAAPSL